MSYVRLVVRELDCDWSTTVHGGTADRVVAALAADPTTLAELETACGRFEKPRDGGGVLPRFSPGLDDEPYDAGIVILDLAARVVVIDSTYSCRGPAGSVEYHNGRSATDVQLPYHLADDWLFLHDIHFWKGTAAARRRERAAKPSINVRAVLYGRPMLEFIGRGVFAAYERREAVAAEIRARWFEEARSRLAKQEGIEPAAIHPAHITEDKIYGNYGSDPDYEMTKDIHAAWLLTPRSDLGGDCPRETMFAQHDHVSTDLYDQQHAWSRLEVCPPRLPPTSHAFLHAGFGTHEMVEYYELVRKLIWSSWDRRAAIEKARPAPAGGPPSFTVGDFLTDEVPRLEAAREAWLDTLDPEIHGRTPRSIIDQERSRLPEAVSGRDAMVDPDCPCCRFAAELPGPTFWHLDGCNMDDEFAFDIYRRTREEREREEREREEWDREYERRNTIEAEERKRLGLEGSRYGRPAQDSVWSRSFFVGDSADLPLGVRLFGIGGRLAELITDLRSKPLRMDEAEYATIPPEIREPRRHIDRLNRAFDNFRAVLASEDISLTATLIQPVIDTYTDTLAEVTSLRPDLAEKCEWLTNDVNNFLRPPSTDAGHQFNFDDSDDLEVDDSVEGSS